MRDIRFEANTNLKTFLYEKLKKIARWQEMAAKKAKKETKKKKSEPKVCEFC